MKKNNENNSTEASAETKQKREIPTVDQLQRWMDTDLSAALYLLTFIKHDKEIKRIIAEKMQQDMQGAAIDKIMEMEALKELEKEMQQEL